MEPETLLTTIFAGVLVGTLAGLFGVGGGIIVVPVLTFLYRKLGFSEDIIAHSAIGTSLATIFFTSFSSLYTHHKRNAVLWKALWILIPGIAIGAYGGSFFASALKSKFLIGIFIFFIFVFSGRMLLGGRKERAQAGLDLKSNEIKGKSEISTDEITKEIFRYENLPSRIVQSFIGLIIGFSSALVGVGGGVFTSTYLLSFKTPIHLAIGTSAAIGFPVAIAGTVSFILNGWNHPLLPEGSMGFVYLPALVGIVLGSVPFAYLGARLSHKMDKN
ncbi:MAG: sulfite exporter TauE/SafE family protein, partial [Leptospira sp.]|nr:sulfite exporter TauE/SafE family protein [Leptospira sp.]